MQLLGPVELPARDAGVSVLLVEDSEAEAEAVLGG